MEAPASLKVSTKNRTLRKAETYVQQNQTATAILNAKPQVIADLKKAPLNPKANVTSARAGGSRKDSLLAYNPVEFKSPQTRERARNPKRSGSRENKSREERTPSREISIRQERGPDGSVKFVLKQPLTDEKCPQESFKVKSRLARLPSLGDLGRGREQKGAGDANEGLHILKRLSSKENLTTQSNNLEMAACAFLAWSKEEKREKERSLSSRKMEDMAQKRRGSERKPTIKKNEPGWYLSALNKKETDTTNEKTNDWDETIKTGETQNTRPTEVDENRKSPDGYWVKVLKNNGGSWLFPLMSRDKNKKKSEELELQKNDEPVNFCGKRLLERRTFNVSETKVLSVRYDNEDEKLAVGCEDGITRIFLPDQNKLHLCLTESSSFNVPVSCLRWHPMTVDSILLTARTNGKLTLWNIRQNKIAAEIDEGNQIYAIDFSKAASHFASGGSDCLVRIYDEPKMKVSQTLTKGKHPGHNNRIYALKFEPQNPNILFSAGWDEVVFAWDLRVGHSVNYIYGPLVCGDSLDVQDMQILTGSWRINNQLEIWDVRKMKLLKSFPWINIGSTDEKTYIYSCQFSKINSNLFAAGSSGTYEIRIFDQLNSTTHIDASSEFQKGIFSIDLSHKSNTFAYGCGAGKAGIMEII